VASTSPSFRWRGILALSLSTSELVLVLNSYSKIAYTHKFKYVPNQRLLPLPFCSPVDTHTEEGSAKGEKFVKKFIMLVCVNVCACIISHVLYFNIENSMHIS
jgi:hypothetical protein